MLTELWVYTWPQAVLEITLVTRRSINLLVLNAEVLGRSTNTTNRVGSGDAQTWYDTVGVVNCTASKCGMTGKRWIEEDLKGNGLSVFEVLFRHVSGETEYNHKESVNILGIQAEIRTGYLSDTSLERYQCSNLLLVLGPGANTNEATMSVRRKKERWDIGEKKLPR
jgi:hypothetical protein